MPERPQKTLLRWGEALAYVNRAGVSCYTFRQWIAAGIVTPRSWADLFEGATSAPTKRGRYYLTAEIADVLKKLEEVDTAL
jgi:hypothetical protein